ncbi:hypothetical protein P791_1234 [Enterococcus faecalis NY9]|nr:hypothetical protein P791_1234 [Enterococcus faecalis NY9]
MSLIFFVVTFIFVIVAGCMLIVFAFPEITLFVSLVGTFIFSSANTFSKEDFVPPLDSVYPVIIKINGSFENFSNGVKGLILISIIAVYLLTLTFLSKRLPSWISLIGNALSALLYFLIMYYGFNINLLWCLLSLPLIIVLVVPVRLFLYNKISNYLHLS